MWLLNGAAGRPSALSPDSRASGPCFPPSITRSSHFQRGNKLGLYGPGRVHCTPDGLLKGHITQKGHCSLRDARSQCNRGGTGGLHSSTSSPPAQSASQPACLNPDSPAIRHPSPARSLETLLVYIPLLQPASSNPIFSCFFSHPSLLCCSSALRFFLFLSIFVGITLIIQFQQARKW